MNSSTGECSALADAREARHLSPAMPPKRTSAPPAGVVRSAALATDFVLYVTAPDRTRNPGPWPAIVVLDGDYFFDAAVAAYRKLRTARKVPPALIAGIGYGRPFGDPGNRRGRDYTPTPSAEEPTSGGADPFLACLEDQLWPELTRRHPLERERSILAGHSLSALFVLYAMFQPRPFFSRALIGAPSIWWDQRSVLAHLARVRERQASLPAHLFLGVGAEETPSMLGDLALLDQQLAARPFERLRITAQRFPGRDHYNLLPDLFRVGLPALLTG